MTLGTAYAGGVLRLTISIEAEGGRSQGRMININTNLVLYF